MFVFTDEMGNLVIKKNIKLDHQLYDYLIITSLLYVSGNFFVMKNYSLSVIMLFAFLVQGRIFNKTLINSFIKTRTLIFLITVIIIMSLSLIFNTFKDAASYIAIFIQLLCAWIVCHSMSREKYDKIFVNIMLSLAIVSLLFYMIGLIFPRFIYLFPSYTRTDLSIRYYNAYIYVFWENTGMDQPFFSNRNAGIFWEPAVYQAFLNIALWYLLREKRIEYRFIKIIILIITILTTYSATGYLILIIQLLFSVTKTLKIVISLIAIILITGIFFDRFGIVSTKLLSWDYIITRTSLDKILILLTHYKPYLFGFTFSGRTAVTQGTVWNSIIDTSFVLGIPFTVVFVYIYYRYCKKNKNIVYFIILIFIFSTVSLMWRPYFMCMLFYYLEGDSSYLISRKKGSSYGISNSRPDYI